MGKRCGHEAAKDVGEPYLGLADQLMDMAADFRRVGPSPDASAEVRGLPAVLHALADAGGMLAPGQIAELTGVTDSRVANILRTLEQRGWVTRTRSALDRRRVAVKLTDRGREVHDQRAAEFRLRCAAFLRELGEDDARQLLHVASRVGEVLSRHARRATPADPVKADPSRRGPLEMHEGSNACRY